jgi:AbrB family looped-hinge helix DNA binding protein
VTPLCSQGKTSQSSEVGRARRAGIAILALKSAAVLLVGFVGVCYIVRMTKNNQRVFYGTATLGEKGQVVIPAEARKAMNIKKGEKLLVFGTGTDMVILSKLSNLERFASHLAKRLETIRRVIKKTAGK